MKRREVQRPAMALSGASVRIGPLPPAGSNLSLCVLQLCGSEELETLIGFYFIYYHEEFRPKCVARPVVRFRWRYRGIHWHGGRPLPNNTSGDYD